VRQAEVGRIGIDGLLLHLKTCRRLEVESRARSLAGIIILVLAGAAMLAAFCPPSAEAVGFGLYQVDFLGASYDAGTNATTFSYRVMAAVGYGIDAWTVELNQECFGTGDVIDASEPFVYAWPDPATLIRGITFTTPYAPGDVRIVWFRLPGNVATTVVRVDVMYTCSHWTKEMSGPDCPGIITPPPPPSGLGKSPGYWKNNLAVYLGLKSGNLNEPNVANYAAQYGYTAQSAHQILEYGGDDMLIKLHRQVLAAKLSTAAGYLSGADQLLEWGQYVVAHPGEFTAQEIEDAKDLFESLHD
jgi:hypothetical protein